MTLPINPNSNSPAPESSKRSEVHHKKGPEKEPFTLTPELKSLYIEFFNRQNPFNNRIVNIFS